MRLLVISKIIVQCPCKNMLMTKGRKNNLFKRKRRAKITKMKRAKNRVPLMFWNIRILRPKRMLSSMFLEICMERTTSSTQITRSGASATIANFVTSSFGSPPGNGSTTSSYSLSYSTRLCWPPQITKLGLSLTTNLSGPQSKSRSTLSFP